MPNIRMRLRNGGPLDFVVVEEEDVAVMEMVGWEIDEDQPPQPREEEERINMPEDKLDIPVGGGEVRQDVAGERPVRIIDDNWLQGAEWPAAEIQADRMGRVVRGGGIGDVPPIAPILRNLADAALARDNGTTPGLRGEELFKLILTGIKEVYDVDAVIAGGAVRDVAAGTMEHKDVDVFIPMKWEDFQKDVGQLGWTGVPYKVNKQPYDGKLKKLPATVRANAHAQGLTLDLIFMERDLTPEYVSTFPVLTQRGVYTLNEGLRLSPEAKLDVENKQFTIDPDLKDKDQIKIIRDKIVEWKKRPHYKNWKIVEPDIKEWWMKKEEPEFVGKKEKIGKHTYTVWSMTSGT